MNTSNPYFKNRKLNPVEDKSLAVKFSSEVWEDFNLHFKEKYPNLIKKNGELNKNQVITKVMIDYLNSQCLERKAFNIDLLLTLEDNKEVSIIGLRDDYKIVKTNSQNEYFEFDRELINEDFFVSDNLMDIETAYSLILDDYFTEYYVSLSSNHDSDKPFKNIHEFKDWIECPYNSKAYLLHLRLNNYLDSLSDGVYKSNSDSNTHKGLAMINLEDDHILYFVYLWSYSVDDNEFKFLGFNVLAEEEFLSVVFNSSNEELKHFVQSQREVKSEEIPSSEEVEINQLKERISELEVTLNNTEKNIKKMSLENDNLKRQLKVYEADKEDSKNRIMDILKEYNAL